MRDAGGLLDDALLRSSVVIAKMMLMLRTTYQSTGLVVFLSLSPGPTGYTAKQSTDVVNAEFSQLCARLLSRSLDRLP